MGGNFTKSGGKTCYWSAALYFNVFVANTNLIGGGGIRQFEVFDNKLYCTNSMDLGSSMGLGVWDGSTWQRASDFVESSSGIYADGNDLYVGSDFGKVHKKTGSGNFSQLGTTFDNQKGVYAISKYNGSIIVAGSFTSVNSTTVNHIARWDGTTWQPLGTGLDGTVLSLAVYNNELYAGGSFNNAGGAPAKFIAKWNGTNWKAVGGSVTSTSYNGVRDMMVYKNDLYVAGDFNKLGTVNAKYLASWNGTSWRSLNFTGIDFLESLEIYNNEMYVGSFDFDSSFVYKNANFEGINENKNGYVNASILTNPATNSLQIKLPEEGPAENETVLEIYSLTGQLISSKTYNSNMLEMEIDFLQTGIYLATIKREGNIIWSGKWVKL
jgi:hypothetical protein